MLTLVLRDLQYRKWRLALVVTLISVVMALLLVLIGLVGQFDREPELAVQQMSGGADFMIAAESSGPFTTPQGVPVGILESVEGARTFLIGRANLGERSVMIVGMDEPLLDYIAGGPSTRSGEIVVADASDLSVGDTPILGGRQARVVGVVSDATVYGGLPLAFVPLVNAQQALVGGQDVVSGALLPVEYDELPSTVKAMSTSEVAEDARKPLDAAVRSIGLVQSLLWVITGVLIATTIFVTATGRVRDIAVLKAVGGRDSALAGTLIVEAVVIALVATAVAALIQRLVRPLFPLEIHTPSATWWQVPLLAVAVALGAALLGVRKVLRTNPAEAFG